MMENRQRFDLQATALVLAAGCSERFGSPKMFLQFNDKMNFLEQVVGQYVKAGVNRVLIITQAQFRNRVCNSLHQYQNKGKVEVLLNNVPGSDRISSLRIGLKALHPGSCVFVQNIDNPFTKAEWLRSMLPMIRPTAYVVPVCGGLTGHPVLLSPEIVSDMLAQDNSLPHLKKVLESYHRMEYLCPDPGVLANINTRDDYFSYFKDRGILN